MHSPHRCPAHCPEVAHRHIRHQCSLLSLRRCPALSRAAAHIGTTVGSALYSVVLGAQRTAEQQSIGTAIGGAIYSAVIGAQRTAEQQPIARMMKCPLLEERERMLEEREDSLLFSFPKEPVGPQCKRIQTALGWQGFLCESRPLQIH
jgi:hypothetical protein